MTAPWKAGWGDGKWSATHEDANSCGHAHIVDSKGTVVAMAVTVGRNDDDAERRDLIVRAVNAHDDLLEAVRALSQIIRDMRADEGFDATTCDAGGILFGDVTSEAIEAADAAIAKASPSLTESGRT